MTVTIRDIARRAGVSVSTASRALNKKSDVSKETQASVLAVARELNRDRRRRLRASPLSEAGGGGPPAVGGGHRAGRTDSAGAPRVRRRY